MDDQAYLDPDFDPSTLTVPRLRSILLAHNVDYPSSAKKQQLIDLFHEHVLSQARRIRAANSRIKRTSRGIEDIATGRRGTGAGDAVPGPVPGPVQALPPTPATARTSTRTTRARTAEAQEVEPTPRRMRHSTAPPDGIVPGSVSGKHAAVVEEESLPKRQRQENSERSVPRTARTRQSLATPVAVKAEPADDTPFSNDNVFQSHATPSDQFRPVSLDSERRRTTMSMARSAQAARDLERRNRDLRRRTDEVRPFRPQTDGAIVPSRKTFDVPIVKREDVKISEDFTPHEARDLAAAQASGELVPIQRQTQGPGKVAKRGVGAFVLVMASAVGGLWRQEKLQVGYCGVGQPSTEIAGVQVPQWANIVRPQCEPCPPHAFCHENLRTECENGFVLTHHPLSVNGLLPLPPTCEPDSAKARKVNAVKERAVEALRIQNAKYECGEASAPALKETVLKNAIATKRRKGMSNEEFEDLWSSAIGDIVGSDEVVSGVDGSSSESTLRSTSLAKLSFSCALRRSFRETLRAYLWQLVGLLLILSGGSYGRYRITSGNETEVKVKQLASHALEKLSYQAALHAQDPDLYQDNHISVAQLRDDVLRDEFSANRRKALWDKVAKKVEGNSNVRSMVKEGRSGDVSRVWEWVGAVGYLESTEGYTRRKCGRVSFAPDTSGGDSSSLDESNGSVVKREVSKISKWEEPRRYY